MSAPDAGGVGDCFRRRRWRLLSVLDKRLDLFAIAYLGGLFLVIGSDQHHPFAWPFVRALVWVVAFPGAYAWGIHDARKRVKNNDGTSGGGQ